MLEVTVPVPILPAESCTVDNGRLIALELAEVLLEAVRVAVQVMLLVVTRLLNVPLGTVISEISRPKTGSLNVKVTADVPPELSDELAITMLVPVGAVVSEV
ncbi:Unknown protein sequence [Pseudomonas amygdali pv. eriobotryae]|uniref:Uncharacterized protein n=1 Tax=Pseudomonas amygdali pv. eriobotryae TaxID=129137 RepID=A0A0P9PXU9_PSEA0|nr:Unknown protein sequence [Pseudomonas amygdali pv. eriobotryae]